MTSNKPNVSLFFPVYNDEKTVEIVAGKALKFLSDIANDYEVIIINDGSPDRSGQIADELAKRNPHVRVIHHEKCKGYGMALRSGFSNARFEWICFTDGDDEYDVFDFYRLFKLRDYYDLIITFRYVKLYSGMRQFISGVYNLVLRFLFRTNYRDISTGLRMVRRHLLQEISLDSTSPFIGAELTIKTMLKGYRVGEVGIQTFPRRFGQSSSTSTRNIIATIEDMLAIRKKIFSPYYDLPRHRTREDEVSHS